MIFKVCLYIDVVGLVKPNAAQFRASLVPIMSNCAQHVENKETYHSAWKYVRQYDGPALEKMAQTAVEEWNGLLEEADDEVEEEETEKMFEVEWAEPPLAVAPAEVLPDVLTKST
eukprot:2419020-Amphidinium_carterae.1